MNQISLDSMKLLPLDSPELIALGAQWLRDEHNHPWLDFASDSQRMDELSLRFMIQKSTNLIRAYTSEDGNPIGLVALSQLDRRFRTGTFWGLLGDKYFSRQGYTVRAASKLFTLAFDELDVQSINTWVVESNAPSVRMVTLLGMRPAGRLRRCHPINGKSYDRLLFDLLPEEHKERSDVYGERPG